MSDGHQHASVRAGARHTRALVVTFVMVVAFMVAEIAGGLLTGSLALLSDAGHMATDALGLGMALAAITAATKGKVTESRTYGLYRLEILAALANATVLFGVAGYVLYEGLERLADPPEIQSGWMLVVAVGGLIVNIIGFRLLREGAEESLNLEGALLEVLADLIGSIGVIIAGLAVRYLDWQFADPLVGAAIGLFILPRAWRLGTSAIRILVQAAPKGLDVDLLRERLASVEGVDDVHDLHVWTLTSDMDVATAHLVTKSGIDPHPILDRAREILQDEHDISHATLQVEPDTHEGCAEINW